MTRFHRSNIAGAAAVAALLLGGCSVEQEQEGDMPDVDVSARGGNLPEYEVRKVEEGDLPDVDVDVDEGRLPDFDVRGPNVDVGTTTRTVKVPKVKVVLEEEEIEVPYIDVDLPDESDDVAALDAERRDPAATGLTAEYPATGTAERRDPAATGTTATAPSAPGSAGQCEQRTVAVTLDVPADRYDVRIEEIYLVDGELWVVSELETVGASATTPPPGAGTAGTAGTSGTAAATRVSDAVVINAPDMEVRHYIIGQRVGSGDPDYRFIASKREIEGDLLTARKIYTAESDPGSAYSQVR